MHNQSVAVGGWKLQGMVIGSDFTKWFLEIQRRLRSREISKFCLVIPLYLSWREFEQDNGSVRLYTILNAWLASAMAAESGKDVESSSESGCTT